MVGTPGKFYNDNFFTEMKVTGIHGDQKFSANLDRMSIYLL